jgi:hypothetical protein
VELQPSRTSFNKDKACSDSSSPSAVSKPPLPPFAGVKLDSEPKAQRVKRLGRESKVKKREKIEMNVAEMSTCVDKKQEEEAGVLTLADCQKEFELGGDDSWEDVTTSGNDSACEELSSHSNTDSTLDVTSTKVKSKIPENTGMKVEMLQYTELESDVLQNAELKSETIQNIEMKSEMHLNTEVKSEMLLNTEVKSDVLLNTEVRSEVLQNTEVKSEMLQTVRSSLNNELDDFTEVTQVIVNKVPDIVMQEVTEKRCVSDGSTECAELKDGSEIHFEKSHSSMLVETKAEAVNETTERTEIKNIQLITDCKEGRLEGEIKTESEERCRHNEEPRKVDVIQTLGSAAADSVPEEKQGPF